jgi:hypothetical protein
LDRKEIFTAAPYRVVLDSDDLVALFLADGTACKLARRTDGGHAVALGPHSLENAIWHRDVLCLMYPSAAHSIWLFWDVEPRRFLWWYVNLEQPFKRTAIGFDIVDHFLDIVILPDFSWHWKDEDELREAVRVGLLSSSQGDAIRAEGEMVLKGLANRRGPFSDAWHHWTPM